jgi:glycosyltransferase involved in cell wall biosynthesis
MKAQGKIVAGATEHLRNRPQIRCPMDQPMWFVGDIGFISVSYMQIGGTETFHRTLVPNIPKVAGFVSLQPALSNGDFSLLNCQYGIGMEAARRLAASVKTLVVWGIGKELGTVLADLPRKPKVVSVSHCDSRSKWTINYMLEQERYTDHFVYINKHGLGTVPLIRRHEATLLYNGIDEKRTRTTHTREQVRTKLNIPQDAKVGIMVTRFSEEKGIREAMVAIRKTKHYLLVVGNASDWNDDYLQEIKGLQTDRIKIIDAVTNPADVLIAADYYLSLSKYEGFGLSMAEAMGMGIQVVSTPVGIVEDEPGCAHLIPHQPDKNEIVEAVSNIKDTRQFAKQLIDTKYSSKAFIQRWQEFLNVSPVQTSLSNNVPNIQYAGCNGHPSITY